MSDPQPVGMLDSGVGGLAVLREVRRLLPQESIIYVGDQGHVPYGPRARDEIRAFTTGIVQFLIDQHCKAIVIPCNAACAAGLHHVRALFPNTSIVGMEPAIKPAVEHTKTGTIGVITTQATYQGELFASVIGRFADGVRVETQVCPKLVLLVEQGAPDSSESHTVIDGYLTPLEAAGIDQLVIGCTHFTFLEDQLRARLGNGVAIVDPASAVARQVQRVLEQRQIRHDPDHPVDQASVQYITTGNPDHMRQLITKLIGDENPDVRAASWDNDHLRL
ncbi:MAG: glutamate racemase [Aggregatilineales bacterium]